MYIFHGPDIYLYTYACLYETEICVLTQLIQPNKSFLPKIDFFFFKTFWLCSYNIKIALMLYSYVILILEYMISELIEIYVVNRPIGAVKLTYKL